MFGCQKHGGKLFRDHTREEREEDGYVEVKPGVWKARAAAPPPGEFDRVAFREFDSGYVPDLEHDAVKEVWKRLGRGYEDGCGPVIRNQNELREACELAGVAPMGQTEVVSDHVRGVYGYERERKKRIHTGFEAVWGRFPRDTERMRERHAKAVADERKAAQARQKTDHRPKKFFSIPKMWG